MGNIESQEGPGRPSPSALTRDSCSCGHWVPQPLLCCHHPPCFLGDRWLPGLLSWAPAAAPGLLPASSHLLPPARTHTSSGLGWLVPICLYSEVPGGPWPSLTVRVDRGSPLLRLAAVCPQSDSERFRHLCPQALFTCPSWASKNSLCADEISPESQVHGAR